MRETPACVVHREAAHLARTPLARPRLPGGKAVVQRKQDAQEDIVYDLSEGIVVRSGARAKNGCVAIPTRRSVTLGFDQHRAMSKRKDINGFFNGRHFDREVIILCMRWYLRHKLSFRDLAEMMVERGLSLVHTTIMRWIRHCMPEFVKRWNRFAAAAGQSS